MDLKEQILKEGSFTYSPHTVMCYGSNEGEHSNDWVDGELQIGSISSFLDLSSEAGGFVAGLEGSEVPVLYGDVRCINPTTLTAMLTEWLGRSVKTTNLTFENGVPLSITYMVV